MKLTLQERYVLSRILPGEGDFLTVTRLHNFRGALEPTEKEIKEFGVKIDEETDRISWNPAGRTEVEIEIGEIMTALTVKTLKKLDETEKLREDHRTLYEKFVEKVQTPPS